MVVRKRLPITGNALVFVTTTVTDWLPVFKLQSAANAVLNQLQDTARHYDISIVGYVLMPSHLHAVLGFWEIEKLSKFMQSFKILSSKKIRELNLGSLSDGLYSGNTFRLWKPRSDDLIITSEKQFRIKLDYIHRNPVKAGLVEKPTEWRYSSAIDWLADQPGIIPVAKEFDWVRN